MDEIWKTSVSVGTYEISSHGRVRHKQSGEIRKLQCKLGHYTVVLHPTIGVSKTITIAKEVLGTFDRPTEKIGRREYARHKDHDILNNHLDNLEWSYIPPPRVMGTVIETYTSPDKDAEIVSIFFGKRKIDVSSDGFIRNDKVWRSGNVESGREYKRLTIEFDREGNSRSNHEDIHFLVAHAFLGPRPEKYVIDHLDSDKYNNNAYNLEYDTRCEKTKRANQEPPLQNPVDQYELNGTHVATYKSQSEASRYMIGNPSGSAPIGETCNGHRDNIYGYTWRSIGDPFERVSRKRKAPVENVAFIGKLKKEGEFIMIGDKFLVKIGKGNAKRPKSKCGPLRGMVCVNFKCDEHDELRKFLVKHEKISILADTEKASTDRFYMTEEEFEMAIGIANDNVGRYIN